MAIIPVVYKVLSEDTKEDLKEVDNNLWYIIESSFRDLNFRERVRFATANYVYS